MKAHHHQTDFFTGEDWRSLPSHFYELCREAIDAADLAYAPYSKFKVGAAIQSSDGELIRGCNQENASYPLCHCAEQVALNKLHSDRPSAYVQYLVIYAHSPQGHAPIAPCGACRQVILETIHRTGHDFELLLINQHRAFLFIPSAASLLPLAFSAKDLE